MVKENINDNLAKCHMEEVFQILVGSDRTLTKDSVSGSEFGQPLYRLYRTRNPDTELTLLDMSSRKTYSGGIRDMMGELNRIRGTAMHLLISELDNISGEPEVDYKLNIDGFNITGTVDRVIKQKDGFFVLDYKNSMSSVIAKVRTIVENEDYENEYIQLYRYQISIYSYLAYKNMKPNMKFPKYGYLAYIPSMMLARDHWCVDSLEYSYVAKIKLLTLEEIEQRIEYIRKALVSEPKFDCVLPNDCKYCTAVCKHNKDTVENF